MKWFLRKYTDGKIETLQELMEQGLSEENLPLWLIRKYLRLVRSYLIAYEEGLDIVQAEQWIRKHRSHRAHSKKMDAQIAPTESSEFNYNSESTNSRSNKFTSEFKRSAALEVNHISKKIKKHYNQKLHEKIFKFLNYIDPGLV